MLRLDIDDNADLVTALHTVSLHGGPVGSQQIMRGDRRLESVSVSWRKGPEQVATVGDDPRLIQRHPFLHPAVELAKQDSRVLGEPFGAIGMSQPPRSSSAAGRSQ
jgi:hypothetical protein